MTPSGAAVASDRRAPDRPAEGYAPCLDGVRAVAVLAIVAFHARSDLLPGAYIGVDLFFVMSGFLITGILLREIERTGRVGLGRFYLRRALRLGPALVVMCAIVGVGFWLLPVTDREASLVGTAAALTYTSSPLAAAGVDLGWMVHTWSLSVEEYFYLVWPLALVYLARRRRPLLAITLLTAVAIGYRLVSAHTTGWSLARIAYAPDTRAEQLLIGCLLAVVLREGLLRVRSWHAALAALAFVAFTLLPGEIGAPLYRDGASTLIALASATLIAGLLQHPDQPLSRLAATPVLVWIGRRSYGIYLWNLPIVALVAATPLPGPASTAVKLALSFAIPAISFVLVEQPFLRLKDRYAARR